MLFTPNAFFAALADIETGHDLLPHGACIRHRSAHAATPATAMPPPAAATDASSSPAWRPRTMHDWLT